jgi:hypothetical protein
MKETRHGDYMEPEDLSPGLPPEEQLEEFSILFIARYLDVARQLRRYFEDRGLHVLFYPVDEPRERNINRWNRNRADTIRYCDLLRENIPGVRVYVNPMRDQDAGTDYLPICNHVDVIGTHPWDESGRIVGKCRSEGRPELWYFNMIAWDRYDFGLQQAASGARGCWQWHYQWDLMPFQPFHPGPKWGVTIPGPEGPLSRPAYELIAQGIDDYRYYATLRSRMERAREAGVSGAAIAKAEAAVASFLESAPPYASRAHGAPGAEPGYPKRRRVGGRNLDGWRELFARHIEAIDRAPGDSR